MSENDNSRTMTFHFAQQIAELFCHEPSIRVEASSEGATVRFGDADWGYEYTITVRKSA
jgi:hypothetical protein